MENAIILGDFNMHIEDFTDKNSQIFVDTMEVFGLQQRVNHYTHQKGNILNLIFTEGTSKMYLRELEILNFISNHQLTSATIDVKKDLLRITKKKITNLKEVDLATLMENFQQPQLNQNTNVSEAYHQLNLKLQQMHDRCAPEKIVKRTEKLPKL